MKFDFIRIVTQNKIKIFDKIYCYLYAYREFFPFVKNDNFQSNQFQSKCDSMRHL